jgi:arabinose-5-phosphate isomerase
VNKAVILQRAKQVLNIEATGIVSLIDRLDDRFIKPPNCFITVAAKWCDRLGKSGLICRKIAATFSSMGTASFSFTPAMPITVTWA